MLERVTALDGGTTQGVESLSTSASKSLCAFSRWEGASGAAALNVAHYETSRPRTAAFLVRKKPDLELLRPAGEWSAASKDAYRDQKLRGDKSDRTVRPLWVSRPPGREDVDVISPFRGDRNGLLGRRSLSCSLIPKRAIPSYDAIFLDGLSRRGPGPIDPLIPPAPGSGPLIGDKSTPQRHGRRRNF